MRKSWLGTVVVVSSMVLPGCAGPVACPAIGWSNNLLVELEGETSSVAEVQGCVDEACSQLVQLRVETDGPIETITPEAPGGTGVGTSQKSSAPHEFSAYTAFRLDADTWSVSFSMTAPVNVTVKALDADGVVLAEEEFGLEWVRVGGSELCGGPEEAGPVTLRIPWVRGRLSASLS